MSVRYGARMARGDKAQGQSAVPGAAPRPLRRRRSRRGNRLEPEGGWGLIGDAAGRLGLWEGLYGYLAQRAFALALKQIVPRLSAHARAEQLAGDTLIVRVSSSAVASELSFVRDLLLTRVNQDLDKMMARGKSSQRTRQRVKQLRHRVGPIAELLDADAPLRQRPPRPRPARPRPQVDTEVAVALGQVQDEALRRALYAMYAASLKEPDPV